MKILSCSFLIVYMLEQLLFFFWLVFLMTLTDACLNLHMFSNYLHVHVFKLLFINRHNSQGSHSILEFKYELEMYWQFKNVLECT